MLNNDKLVNLALVFLVRKPLSRLFWILLDFSEEQLVDCDTKDFGCRGGWPNQAWIYLQNARGSAKSSLYPYTASNGAVIFSFQRLKNEWLLYRLKIGFKMQIYNFDDWRPSFDLHTCS